MSASATVDRRALADAVRAAAAAARRYHLAGAVKLTLARGRIFVDGSDGVISLSLRLDAEGPEEAVACGVNGRLLAEVLAAGDGRCEVRIEDGVAGRVLVVEGGAARHVLRTVPVEDLPAVPDGRVMARPVDPHVLAAGIARVLPAASNDPGRPVLCGVLVEPDAEAGTTTLVATDSYRLAVCELPVVLPGPRRAVVPAGALRLLVRLIERDRSDDGVTHWLVEDGRLTAGPPSATLVAALVGGEFPEWRRFVEVPADAVRVECGRDQLLAAVERVGLVAPPAIRAVRLHLVDGRLTVEAESDVGRASETVGAVGAGDAEVALNFRYLADALEAADADVVSLAVADPLKPVLISGGRFVSAVMPVRLA